MDEFVDNYRDILDLPHYVSAKHPPMSMMNRAAQFAPFAALNGYEEASKKGVTTDGLATLRPVTVQTTAIRLTLTSTVSGTVTRSLSWVISIISTSSDFPTVLLAVSAAAVAEVSQSHARWV